MMSAGLEKNGELNVSVAHVMRALLEDLREETDGTGTRRVVPRKLPEDCDFYGRVFPELIKNVQIDVLKIVSWLLRENKLVTYYFYANACERIGTRKLFSLKNGNVVLVDLVCRVLGFACEACVSERNYNKLEGFISKNGPELGLLRHEFDSGRRISVAWESRKPQVSRLQERYERCLKKEHPKWISRATELRNLNNALVLRLSYKPSNAALYCDTGVLDEVLRLLDIVLFSPETWTDRQHSELRSVFSRAETLNASHMPVEKAPVMSGSVFDSLLCMDDLVRATNETVLKENNKTSAAGGSPNLAAPVKRPAVVEKQSSSSYTGPMPEPRSNSQAATLSSGGSDASYSPATDKKHTTPHKPSSSSKPGSHQSKSPSKSNKSVEKDSGRSRDSSSSSSSSSRSSSKTKKSNEKSNEKKQSSKEEGGSLGGDCKKSKDEVVSKDKRKRSELKLIIPSPPVVTSLQFTTSPSATKTTPTKSAKTYQVPSSSSSSSSAKRFSESGDAAVIVPEKSVSAAAAAVPEATTSTADNGSGDISRGDSCVGSDESGLELLAALAGLNASGFNNEPTTEQNQNFNNGALSTLVVEPERSPVNNITTLGNLMDDCNVVSFPKTPVLIDAEPEFVNASVAAVAEKVTTSSSNEAVMQTLSDISDDEDCMMEVAEQPAPQQQQSEQPQQQQQQPESDSMFDSSDSEDESDNKKCLPSEEQKNDFNAAVVDDNEVEMKVVDDSPDEKPDSGLESSDCGSAASSSSSSSSSSVRSAAGSESDSSQRRKRFTKKRKHTSSYKSGSDRGSDKSDNKSDSSESDEEAPEQKRPRTVITETVSGGSVYDAEPLMQRFKVMVKEMEESLIKTLSSKKDLDALGERLGGKLDNIRILHECQVWIDKSVPRATFWHHEARRVMPNCDTRDRFVYPYPTRMMDSFSCTP